MNQMYVLNGFTWLMIERNYDFTTKNFTKSLNTDESEEDEETFSELCKRR